MKSAALVLVLCVGPAILPAQQILTFDEAFARAKQAHAIAMPDGALQLLEHPQRFEFPIVRAEGTMSSARNIDIFNSAVVSVDYPLFDGGVGEIQRQIAKLDAETFRLRASEREAALFDETVDAVARLYLAQERRKILQAGFDRAIRLRDRANQLLTVREISNATAAQWQDEAITAESQLVDLELQRLDAETRLKALIGSNDPIEVVLDLDDVPAGPAGLPDLHRDRSELVLQEASAARRTQVMLSAFGGLADHGNSLYGLRMSLTLPMFNAAAKRREAQARLEAAEAELERTAMLDHLRAERSNLSMSAAALEKRIELLTRAVDIAKQRADSVARLTSAGLRSDAALAESLVDVDRRASELFAARVELWRVRWHRSR